MVDDAKKPDDVERLHQLFVYNMGPTSNAESSESRAREGLHRDNAFYRCFLLAGAVVLVVGIVRYLHPNARAERAAERAQVAQMNRQMEAGLPALRCDLRAVALYDSKPWAHDTSVAVLNAIWHYSRRYFAATGDTTTAGLPAANQPALDSLHLVAALRTRDSRRRGRP